MAFAPEDLELATRTLADLEARIGELPVTAWSAKPDALNDPRSSPALDPPLLRWLKNRLPAGVPPGPLPAEQLLRRALGCWYSSATSLRGHR